MNSPDGKQMMGAKRRQGGSVAIGELSKMLQRGPGGGAAPRMGSMLLSKFK